MVQIQQLAERIISEQELVIGPLAWREAKKVHGLTYDHGKVSMSGDSKKVLSDLVRRYEGLFGPASLDVCREAVKTLVASVPASEVPEMLR